MLNGDMPLQRLAWKVGSSALTLDLARCAPYLSGAGKEPSELAPLRSMRAGESITCCWHHAAWKGRGGRQNAAPQAHKIL